jgi:hypothetical protein
MASCALQNAMQSKFEPIAPALELLEAGAPACTTAASGLSRELPKRSSDGSEAQPFQETNATKIIALCMCIAILRCPDSERLR